MNLNKSILSSMLGAVFVLPLVLGGPAYANPPIPGPGGVVDEPVTPPDFYVNAPVQVMTPVDESELIEIANGASSTAARNAGYNTTQLAPSLQADMTSDVSPSSVNVDSIFTPVCQRWLKVSGFAGRYGPVSQAKCATWGAHRVNVGYDWVVQAGTNQSACAQGHGYTTTYPQKRLWRSVGCGKKAYRTVHWGNVLDYRKIQVRSMGVHVANVQWR